MFAAIHFGVGPPGFLRVAAGLLEQVGGVKPALEMASAKLAFLVLLVAGALSRFLDFDFVVGKLRCLRACGNGCGQKVHLCSSGSCRWIRLRRFILLESFCGTLDCRAAMDWTAEAAVPTRANTPLRRGTTHWAGRWLQRRSDSWLAGCELYHPALACLFPPA
jgi:hypothetical protein